MARFQRAKEGQAERLARSNVELRQEVKALRDEIVLLTASREKLIEQRDDLQRTLFGPREVTR